MEYCFTGITRQENWQDTLPRNIFIYCIFVQYKRFWEVWDVFWHCAVKVWLFLVIWFTHSMEQSPPEEIIWTVRYAGYNFTFNEHVTWSFWCLMYNSIVTEYGFTHIIMLVGMDPILWKILPVYASAVVVHFHYRHLS